MTRLLYRPHIWNVIHSARSNRCHPTSPNTAPATKNDIAICQRKSPKTGETSFPMRGRSDHDPSIIREWSENENANPNPPRKWGYFARSLEAFSIVKYNVLHPILHSNFHQILRLPRKVPLERHQVLRLPRKVPLERHQVLRLPRKTTLELHQVVRLPRKVTLELHQLLRLPRKVKLELHQLLRLPRKKTRLLYRPRIWNVISNARSNRCHYPTSPNTAPTTKNDIARFQRKSPKTAETSFPMRGRSEHDPTIIRPWNRQSATRLATEVTFRTHHEHFLLKNTRFCAQSYIQTFTKCCTCHQKVLLQLHQILRLPRKVTLELHQVVRLPRKVTLELHQVVHLPRKVTLEFQQVLRLPQKWHLNFTKYCACHEKWLDCLIVLTHKTSFPMRGTTGVTIQPRQILRLPRKITLQDFKENLQKQVKRHCQCGTDPTMIRA